MANVDWEDLTRRALGRDSQDREAAIQEAVHAYEAAPSRTGRTRLRAILRIGLADRDALARTLATEEIGNFGLAADALALRDRLDDAELMVRLSAVSSLGQLLGRRARRDLLVLLADEDPFARRYAAVALHDALGAEALPLVQKAYAVEDDELALSGMAYVLAANGDAAAIAQLIELADSPYPRVASPARSALERIGVDLDGPPHGLPAPGFLDGLVGM